MVVVVDFILSGTVDSLTILSEYTENYNLLEIQNSKRLEPRSINSSSRTILWAGVVLKRPVLSE